MRPHDLRLAVLTGRVPHYRASFFDALASQVGALDVIVAGRKDESFLKCSRHRFKVIPLSGERPRWRADVVRTVSSLCPDLLISEHGAGLDYVWTALLSPTLRHIPKVLWTHGIISRDLYGRKRGLGYFGRMRQLHLADGVVCYDAAGAGILSSRLPAKVIGTAPNSNDGSIIVAARARLISEGRAQVRARLGLIRRFYLLFLGRLVPQKDVRRVVPILKRLKTAGIDVGLIIVGHGPEETYLRQSVAEAGLSEDSDVIFVGSVADHEQLAEWLFVADACLSPGALGLSVVDSLYGGLPVISVRPGRRGPWHGPEWHYLEEGKTGFFATDDTNEALTACCASYLAQSEAHRVSVSELCTVTASRRLGIGQMVDGMLTTVCDVIERRKPVAR